VPLVETNVPCRFEVTETRLVTGEETTKKQTYSGLEMADGEGTSELGSYQVTTGYHDTSETKGDRRSSSDHG
jgi:hypothetical protein